MPRERSLPVGYLEQFRERLLKEAPELLSEAKTQKEIKRYSFDVQWAMYEYGEITWELDLPIRVQYFYEYLRKEPGSLNKALVLDAGCGNGTLTAGIAASGPEIIGMDYSESVERAEREKRRFAGEAADRVHYVQGDVQHPPFASATFDVIYSDGVLHHTPNTYESFKALAPLVSPGGRFFVWLYRSDLAPLDNVKIKTVKCLQILLRPLPLSVLKMLCFAGAAILLVRLQILHLLGNRKRRIVPLRLKAVNLFDTLTPRYYHLHTPGEVESWFSALGFPGATETSIPSLSRGGFGMLGMRETRPQAVASAAAASFQTALDVLR
jgi:2-polyprenyl-3-methyl-5-hydroxy-6-metoxy-1,4-benzoquinol methylase